ncbi:MULTISPECIES: YitT family protein [Aminobacterium]|uniref:YitT family protein n=1 Tax=Aminobacterium TaxID=81466 RepID=UPI0004B76EE6|nr:MULTISPECIES: YitT family protein [Aminobacterium]
MKFFSLLKKTLFHLGSALRSEWQTFAAVIVGNVLMALAVVIFIMPNRFPDLGVSGLAVLSNYVWGISPSWVILIGNAILMLWAWRELSPRFVIWTLFSIILFSFLIKVFEFIPFLNLNDKFMAAVVSGVIKGFGAGLILRMGASTGGLDIPGMALRKRYGIEMGQFSISCNSVILLLSAFVVGIQSTIYGVVALYIYGIVLDNTTRSFDRRKQVFVITNHPHEVSGFITGSLHRGVTLLHGEGGFSGKERIVLLALLEPRQVVALKRFLAENDPHAFMSINEASEVVGKGFKSWKSL